MTVQKVSFACMSEGTAEDFQLCDADIENDARALPDRMLPAVAALDDPSGCLQVTRLEHSLQSATRAYDDGKGEPLQFFEPMVRSVFTRSPRMVDMAGVAAGGAE
jgi:predicted HD phosphohydrolase